MNPLIQLALQETPAIVAWIRSSFVERNPNAPPLTDEDVILALSTALKSSIEKDEAWLAVHPNV